MTIKFTPREISILKELVIGKSYPQISSTLFISVSTVKHYMSEISNKIGVKGRINILLYILENRYIIENRQELTINKNKNKNK